MELGRKIYYTREDKNISQQQLAKQLGVSKNLLNKWENCEEMPDLKNINKLSKALDISVNELIDNDIRNLISEKKINNKNESNSIYLFKMVGLILLILILLLILFCL